MPFLRTTAIVCAGALAAAAPPALATPLAAFIDLQEAGLSVAEDGKGLRTWNRAKPATLEVQIAGPVRFALLYWSGRERPCALVAATCTFTQPFRDQRVVFAGTPLTGTVIGTETQPVSGGGPILNIGYFADVTAIVSAAGLGDREFTFADGDRASDLWRLDGVGLFVAFVDPDDPKEYRLLVSDNLDFAYGDDPTPGGTRFTKPLTIGHGATSFARPADLWLFAGDGVEERPDHTTISHNPTLFDILDGEPDGPAWTSDLHPIHLRANLGTTVVQMHSEPRGHAPDSLLWQLAALRVALPDEIGEEASAPPRCTIRLTETRDRVIATLQDTGSGLARVEVTRARNADTVVPELVPGTTEPVVVTSTRRHSGHWARVAIRATDGVGNVALCDPIYRLAVGAGLSPAVAARADVPPTEDKVTVRNGDPGLVSLTIEVNGRRFKLAGLESGEERTVDVSAGMVFERNTVTFEGRGTAGSSAEVVLWGDTAQ